MAGVTTVMSKSIQSSAQVTKTQPATNSTNLELDIEKIKEQIRQIVSLKFEKEYLNNIVFESLQICQIKMNMSEFIKTVLEESIK